MGLGPSFKLKILRSVWFKMRVLNNSRSRCINREMLERHVSFSETVDVMFYEPDCELTRKRGRQPHSMPAKRQKAQSSSPEFSGVSCLQ